MASAQQVRENAKCIEINGQRSGAADGDFWRKVTWSAGTDRVALIARFESGTKIHQDHATLKIKHHIARLDVAVHKPSPVHRMQCVGELKQNTQQLIAVQAAPIAQSVH